MGLGKNFGYNFNTNAGAICGMSTDWLVGWKKKRVRAWGN